MWRQTFKIALRNLFKQKLFTSINIFGLAIGLAGSLLIAVFVWNELSYESMHEKADDIYRIAVQFGQADDSMILAGAMPALGPAAKEELPEVEEFARVVLDRNAPIIQNKNEFTEGKFFLADPTILELFNINILEQVDVSPLSDPFDLMISRSAVEKYFGNENPIGKVLQYRGQNLKITGVFEDVLGNTQINPDFITSYKTKEIVFPSGSEWGNFGRDNTYLLLNTKISAQQLNEKLTSIVIKNTSQQFADMIKLIPEHFPGIYLNSETRGDLIPHGNKSYVYLFSTIALFVLFIASLNFINLSTARSFRRAKEVGIKKVLGAIRRQLVTQFLAESILVTLIALVFGLVLFEIFYPVLTGFLEIQVGIAHFKTVEFYLLVVAVFLFVALLSGIYPALFLTRFNPLKTVKGEVGKANRGFGFRKVLVVAQFAISILLIFGTTVIFQQLNYMRDYDIGIEKDNVVIINYSPQGEGAEVKYETLKNKLLGSNEVKSVSGVYTLPGLNSMEKQTIRLKEQPEENQKVMRFNGVDYSFINTFNIDLVAGRDFNRNFSTDKEHAVILNERAVREFGMRTDEIVGKQVILPSPENEEALATIIGIAKNFHIESLHKALEPVVLYINPQRFHSVAVKISPQNKEQTLSYIESTWNEVFPNEEIFYSHLDEKYAALYSSEEKIYQVFTIFAFLAIYIAALGLLGLSSFSAEQRRKEIGIRKVLGSTVNGIVSLLSIDFLKLVIISAVIALPVSYYLMNEWLSDFAFRIEISYLPFFLALMLALIITLITVSSQALRAATINPVDSIKYE